MAKRNDIEALTIKQLQREIRRREMQSHHKIVYLQKRRAKIAGKLASIDAEIARLGGRITGHVRVRPRNDANLADSLVNVLKGEVMNVTGVALAVQRAGYRTTSPNFRTIVNQTLLRDPRIKRVSRGRYTAK